VRAAYRQRLLNIGQVLEARIRHSGVLWPFLAFRNTSVLGDTPQAEIDAARAVGRHVFVVGFVASDGDGRAADAEHPAVAPPQPEFPLDEELTEYHEVAKASVWDRL